LAGFDTDQLAMGVRIETEHTKRPEVALEIALAHLREMPDYYTRLERMEESGSRRRKSKSKSKRGKRSLEARYEVRVRKPDSFASQVVSRHASRQAAEEAKSQVRGAWIVKAYRAKSPTREPAREQRAERSLDKAELWKSITKDQRKADQEKLAKLRSQVKQTRKSWQKSRPKVQSYCLSDRLKSREQARALRQKAREESKARAAAIRAAARGRCAVQKSVYPAKIQTAQEAYKAERKYQSEMRRIDRMNRSRARALKPAGARVRQGESDDEVRQNIDPDLVPLFERVKRQIKPGPRKSHTEAFLEYVESHPREQHAGVEARTEALVRELERQQRAGRV
jgi:hypothetical protein